MITLKESLYNQGRLWGRESTLILIKFYMFKLFLTLRENQLCCIKIMIRLKQVEIITIQLKHIFNNNCFSTKILILTFGGVARTLQGAVFVYNTIFAITKIISSCQLYMYYHMHPILEV